MMRDNKTSFGHYRIERRISVGGTAEVFKAHRESPYGIEKFVALKIILPDLSKNSEFSQLFIDEARLLTYLQHPNITQLHDFGEMEGRLYLATEYVEGVDLAKLIQKTNALQQDIPIDIACFICLQLARALAYAHEAKLPDGTQLGAIHRDVSPHNVLISRNGEVKLTDFGIAESATKSSRTQTGIVRGKLKYMSPEQFLGHKLTPKSDQYSLGLTFFESLTGTLLGASTPSATEEAVAKAPSAFRKDTPEALDALCERILEKEPAKRFQSCSDIAEYLANFLGPQKIEKLPKQLSNFVNKISPAEELDWEAPIYNPQQRIARGSRSLKVVLLFLAFAIAGLAAERFLRIQSTPELKFNGHITPESSSPTPDPSAPTSPSETPLKTAPSPAPKSEVKKPAPSLRRPCPSGMQFVQGGRFLYGSKLSDPDRNDLLESSEHLVEIDKFCIDQYEFPNSRGVLPLTNITWREAETLCDQQSKRLCRELEWEVACKGSLNKRYPYGDEFERGICNTDQYDPAENPYYKNALTASGFYEDCRSDFEVWDQSGNVAEWVIESGSFEANSKVIRGGSAFLPGWASRCSSIREAASSMADPHIGFRCCKEANE